MSSQIHFSIFSGIDFVGQFFDVDGSKSPILRSSYEMNIFTTCQNPSNITGTVTVIDAPSGLNQVSILGANTLGFREGIYRYSVLGVRDSSGINEVVLNGSIRIRGHVI